MTRADSVLSTPPTNTSAKQSRRSILGAIAAAAAAVTVAGARPLDAALAMPAVADNELIALVEQYIAAEAEHARLCEFANELEDAFLGKGKPAALRVQPEDAELGIRAFIGRLGDDHNSFNIDVLRNVEWPHPYSTVEIGVDGSLIVSHLSPFERFFEPCAEARARADELIAASEQWQKTRDRKKPRRLVTAHRKRDQACGRMNELEERITETPATSIAGMIAKARCAKAYDANCYPDCDDPLSMFSASIVRDLLAMAQVQS
jgi:hypothetical protein